MAEDDPRSERPLMALNKNEAIAVRTAVDEEALYTVELAA